jgi:branched-chain amino acid aminotransferase
MKMTASAHGSRVLGDSFTDHMFTACWSSDRGWHDTGLVTLQPLELHPASLGLHYGQAIFEGLKAYRQVDGSVALFRPLANARRFRRSARRMMMPELPEELFLRGARELVGKDIDTVPDDHGGALYVRPLLLATEPGLIPRPASSYRLIMVASPADPVLAVDRPATVWVTDDYARAAAGGTGDIKCAGNYGASLIAHGQAVANGCDQVVWLDPVRREYVEEMGGMNLFFVYGAGADARVVTPSASGTLLPGVTRDTLLTLAAACGLRTEERRVTLAEWCSELTSGAITEMFACGTAAAVAPVGRVRSSEGDWQVRTGIEGPVTRRLRGALADVQRGAAADEHHWLVPV